MDKYAEMEFAPITERTVTALDEGEVETLNRIASSKLGQKLTPRVRGPFVNSSDALQTMVRPCWRLSTNPVRPCSSPLIAYSF
jgi:hypothetical protein